VTHDLHILVGLLAVFSHDSGGIFYLCCNAVRTVMPYLLAQTNSLFILCSVHIILSLFTFDAVGWVAGRASGL